jgi:hypothetical protein
MLIMSTATLRWYRCARCGERQPDDLVADTPLDSRAIGDLDLVTRTNTPPVSIVERAAAVFKRIHRQYLQQTAPLLVEREPGEEG